MPADVALERFRELDPTVPVIIISGTQDEEAARATLANGAFCLSVRLATNAPTHHPLAEAQPCDSRLQHAEANRIGMSPPA